MPRYRDLSDKDIVLRPRQDDAHKGDFGEVLLVGGSTNMPGAPVLAAISALVAGAGRVTVVLPAGRSFLQCPPEITYLHVKGKEGNFTAESAREILRYMENRAVIPVIGPGIGMALETNRFLQTLMGGFLARFKAHHRFSAVLDADGLNLLSPTISKAEKVDMPYGILTPHPGEMARLLGTSTKRVQEVRERCAEELSMRTDGVVVLKGAGTLIAGDTKRYRCPLGNPYMATPGSGDVLSGVIASLLAQGYSRLEAASYGVYIHAKAGDAAHEATSGPIVASDITRYLSKVMGGLVKDR